MNKQYHSIAYAFAELLAEEIGKENYRIVVNRNDPKSSVCLSHDYCDANMVMEAAVNSHGIESHRMFSPCISDEYMAAHNGAWSIFKQLGPDLLG